MFKNKKGVSIITIGFWVLTFLIVWFMFLGKWLGDTGRRAVINNNLTGIEALFFDNINLVIWIGLILFLLAYSFLGGEGK